MRKTVPLVVLVLALGACRQLGLKGGNKPAYRGSTTTSIWGDWVLTTPDSTAFRGASLVEMNLKDGMFTINARYPNQAAVISGTASLAEGGVLTLTPTSGTVPTMGSGGFAMETGKPYTVTATASGHSLVFASATATVPQTSSTWVRKDKAQQAGIVPPAGSKP
jgi:hypothetical protein